MDRLEFSQQLRQGSTADKAATVKARGRSLADDAVPGFVEGYLLYCGRSDALYDVIMAFEETIGELGDRGFRAIEHVYREIKSGETRLGASPYDSSSIRVKRDDWTVDFPLNSPFYLYRAAGRTRAAGAFDFLARHANRTLHWLKAVCYLGDVRAIDIIRGLKADDAVEQRQLDEAVAYLQGRQKSLPC